MIPPGLVEGAEFTHNYWQWILVWPIVIELLR
jgi:hypothetical protein